MPNPLQKITAKAKILYRTGRYKKWTDAVKAASKEFNEGKLGAIKIIQKGETKKSPVKKVFMQKRSSAGTFKGYKKVSGDLSNKIGSVMSGSHFYYYRGIQIEGMIVQTDTFSKNGKKLNSVNKRVFIEGKAPNHTIHHSLSSAKKYIDQKLRKKN